MSQENVEIVRACLEDFSRGDFHAAFANTTPDFELDLSRALGPYRGVYGAGEYREIVDEFSSNWEEQRLAADEFIVAQEHVVTPFTNRISGRDGMEVEARGTWLWTIRNGSLAKLCLYQDLSEALEAAGLSD
jgi:ketosteroid isomerase-like protein